MVNFHGYEKRSDEAPMTLNASKLKGCFDARGKRANHDVYEVVINFPPIN